MKTFVKIDDKNLKEIVDFYFSSVIDIAKTGKQYERILNETPELQKKLYSHIQSEISSKKGKSIEIDYGKRLSSNRRFIKKAQFQVLAPIIEALGAEGMKEIIATGMGAEEVDILTKFKEFFGNMPEAKGFFDWLKKEAKGYINELLDLDLLKKYLILDKTLEVGAEKERYSPSAYQFLLESKGPRGIDNSYVSKGAYDLPSKKLYQQYQDMKMSSPELFEKKMDFPEFEKFREKQVPTIFYNDIKKHGQPKPSTQIKPPTKKPKYDGTDKEANNNSRFVKVAQSAGGEGAPVINQQIADDIKKLFPKWKFDDLINEIKNVSANTQIGDTEKQEQYRQVIAKYQKSIQPLHKYIEDISKQK